ncbi:MAG: glycosyltransferase family 39 protein [Roseiflexaceae bacterium]
MKSERSSYISSASTEIAQASSKSRALPWTLLGYLVIGLAALLPRVLDLGAFLNADEAMFWLQRSETFWRALGTGDFAATAISTHPGVTTMWLGGLGLRLQDLLLDRGIVRDGSFATFLALVRLPLALTHAAGVLLGYGLLRRLLPAVPAALAALFWAADPFIIGYSRMLHVDALAGTFLTLSLLAACLYWHHDARQRWLVLSGVCAGLAILSKSPALALLPVVGLVALAAAFRPPTTDHREPRDEQRTKNKEQKEITRSPAHPFTPSPFHPFIWSLLTWGAALALTVLVLWPALWAGPQAALAQLRLGVEAEGAGTHVSGNFFLGREDDVPGPLFYPVALALRLTPWTLLGLLALPLALHRAQPATRRDLVALAGFVVLFVAALSIFPNKLNRYLIPAFPLVDILAATGLLALVNRLKPLGDKLRLTQSAIYNLQSAILGLVALLALANAAWWHPYGIAAFNQALGGAPLGARTFLIGTGEGMQQIAAWLNQQPDITGVVTVSPAVQTLQPYLRRGARAINPSDGALPSKAGYIVVYGRQTQRSELFPPFDQFYGQAIPLHIVNIHGVDYAWIYQAPPPLAQPRPADFGPAIRLRGFDQASPPARGQPLALTLAWQARAPAPADAVLFAHLIGPDGRRYAQADLPLPAGQWTPGRFVSTALPLQIPTDAPAGAYRLTIGLYDPAGGQRLPLAADAALDPAVDGPDALLLAEFELK